MLCIKHNFASNTTFYHFLRRVLHCYRHEKAGVITYSQINLLNVSKPQYVLFTIWHANILKCAWSLIGSQFSQHDSKNTKKNPETETPGGQPELPAGKLPVGLVEEVSFEPGVEQWEWWMAKVLTVKYKIHWHSRSTAYINFNFPISSWSSSNSVKTLGYK